jgi:hypothetical protein
MKRILSLFFAFAFLFSLVSTNVVFFSGCTSEKAEQAEEEEKGETAAPAESEGAKAPEAAEPEKAEEE